MWLGLTGELQDMFELMAGVFDRTDTPEVERSLPFGFHAHEHLTTSRNTTHCYLSDEERKARRQVLEAKRRAYKTAKQRGYDAKRRAAA